MGKNIRKSTFLSAAIIILMISCVIKAHSAPEGKNLLPNGQFERSTSTQNKKLPDGWTAYEWGQGNNRFEVTRQDGAGRNRSSAILAHNIDINAKSGIYTHVPLDEGIYEFSVWARADKGKTAQIRLYLASAYSPVYTVGDQWKQIRFSNSTARGGLAVSENGSEINIQNVSNEESLVWFDDAILRQITDINYTLTPDTRPDRPRTLLFSAINIHHLYDTVEEWSKRGFRGFLLSGIVHSQNDNPWATDGKATTQGENDELLQAVLKTNRACKRAGIDSNFIKMGLYFSLPDPYDDAAWEKITQNFRETARFARLSESVGIALDTEYVKKQYQPASWPEYNKDADSLMKLKAKFRQRWYDITSAMLKEFPDMVLLTMPEGVIQLGELYQDLFEGMLSAMEQKQAPGGLHIMTENSYHMVGITSLKDYAESIHLHMQESLDAPLLSYWNRYCSVGLGAWPLGYYRPVLDDDGKMTGYSGRKKIYGDKIVGSYADKSAWYSPETFKIQMAGINTFSPRYNWIYAHGDVFWQWTEEEKLRYAGLVGDPLFRENRVGRLLNGWLPVTPDLEKYFEVLSSPHLAEPEQ